MAEQSLTQTPPVIHERDLVLICQAEQWTTVAVTPITGWVNIYRDRGGYRTETAPAILTQESTAWIDYYHIDPHGCAYEALKTERHEHQRETRVVFGELPLFAGNGCIHPVVEAIRDQDDPYVTTLPVEEASKWLASRSKSTV
jgi:hypothetical protein